MREILFRAKDEASNKWVYGYYVHLPSAAGAVHIMQVPAGNPDESNTAYYIIPETVGEYTGLTDRNGKKIFEGDILKGVQQDLFIMKWHRGQFIAENKIDWLFGFEGKAGEIIGNIHDNPEVVEGDTDDQP